MMAIVRVPTDTLYSEPVSVDEAREHCRIDYDDEDALLAAYITAAREYAETVTRRTLISSTWDHTLDRFPAGGGAIRLPFPPLIEVEGVYYIDPDGETQTLDPGAYQWDARQEPGLVMPAPGYSWPATRRMPGAVWIRYRAGYPNGVIPGGVRVAILLMVGHWFANREAVTIGSAPHEVPLAVDRLLWAHRLYEVA